MYPRVAELGHQIERIEGGTATRKREIGDLVEGLVDVETKLVPKLGAVPLQRLTGAHLDGLYAELLARLSPSSVRHVHVVAHRALRDAMRNDLVPRNAPAAATPPRVARKELSVWNASQARAFLASVEDDRLRAAWWLLATAGLRRGEALGLRWQDLSADRLAVVRSLTQRGRELAFTEPKTRRGRRSLALDERTVAILNAHRRRQLEERLMLGLGRPAPDGLIFTNALGEPLRPDSFSQTFDRHVAKLDLPRIRLHDLRHTAATLMLASGANVKTVSERLGHASTAFTWTSTLPACLRSRRRRPRRWRRCSNETARLQSVSKCGRRQVLEGRGYGSSMRFRAGSSVGRAADS